MSCLIHLSWWYSNFNVRFLFTLVSRCKVVIDLLCLVIKTTRIQIFIVLDNDIDTRWISICRSIINKVWIVFLTWKVTKVDFFSGNSITQCCIRNFTTSWFINQTNKYIWICCTICLVYRQCDVIVFVVKLVVWRKIPNTKCQTTWSWVSCISWRDSLGTICKGRTVWIWHSWRYTNTRWICAWSSNSIQLCVNCWSTIYCCVTSKSCCSQGCHHVIYWLAQTFALLSVWLSWSISVDQAVACCQFCLNFSDCCIKCCFLFWSWNSSWVVSCDLVQQGCFWSVLF